MAGAKSHLFNPNQDQPMQNTLKTLACLPMLWATLACATSLCTGDGCIDEASASFVAPYDFFEAKCSSVNPSMRERYSAVATHFLQDADADFLKKLRASEAYARVFAEIESRSNSLGSDQLGNACEEFSKNQDPISTDALSKQGGIRGEFISNK